MLTRRSFFSMITGALGSWALPWKAKAATVCVAGQGPVYPAGVKMSIYQPIELLIDLRELHGGPLSAISIVENPNWRSRRDRLLADYDPMAGAQWLSVTKEISIEEARRGWPIPTDLTCLKS